MLTTSGWTHGGTGRSGLPDSHELQAWAVGSGLVGETPVPLVIAGLLTVLAVACIVAGAWGGQVLTGRQESRRCQRERDRESQAFWRGQRLTTSSTRPRKRAPVSITCPLNTSLPKRVMP